MATLIAQHSRPTVGVEEVREYVRRDVDPADRHHDPLTQIAVAQWVHGLDPYPTQPGEERRTMRGAMQRFGLRDVNAAKSAAFYGRRTLGIAQPTRRRNGRTEVATATGWMVVASRKWGVEVEIAGLGVTGAAAALRREGVDVEERHGWTQHGAARGHDRPTVKVEPDGTTGVTAEAVLPPVSGDEGVALLRTVMGGLKSGGARISSACGMHVHVDANDLTAEQMVALVDSWETVQTAVYSLVPAGRRRSQWCPPLSRWDADDLRSRLSSGTLVPGSRQGVNRYKGLNLDAYRAYGTVEFRIHGGSLNATKARHWVALVVGIVEAARLGVALDGTNAATLTQSLADAGLLPTDSVGWLTRRAETLR